MSRGPGLALAQPFLFDQKLLPLRQDLVALVKEKSFLHTGKILGRDEELCRAVCQDLVAGLSGRKTAKKYGISRNSVLAIETVMRERGELEPLKKGVMRLLDEFIYLGLERVVEAVAEDEIHPGQLPIPIMAAIDKKGQIEAGVVPGTERSVAEVTAEQVQAAFAAMKRARVLTVSESHSEGLTLDAAPIAAQALPDTAQDTSQARPAPLDGAAPEGGGGFARAQEGKGGEGNG